MRKDDWCLYALTSIKDQWTLDLLQNDLSFDNLMLKTVSVSDGRWLPPLLSFGMSFYFESQRLWNITVSETHHE